MATLTAATLVIAGVLVYAIELQRLEEQTLAAVDQELQEFDRIQSEGIDPTTGEPFADVAAMLELFFQRNIPDDDELLVGWISTRPDPVRFVSPAADPLVDERDTMRTYAIVSALALLLVAGVAFAVTGRLLAPLRRLRRTAEEISELDLSRRIPVTGNDDITALTGTVNTMLDRLESAFVEQRRFLDDAGHELRTPLTVLRGHLEVLDTRSQADVDETRDLLLDEVDRMSRLVGDLILLAKSDRPDFVRVAHVDVRELTEDLLAKCSGLGSREWLLDEMAEASVEVDAQRLTQAVLQLAHNAVRHTSAGDPVAIGSSYDGTRLRLWVRDTGPGLAPDDRTRVFERFARAASEDHDGFGLGLSIVSAIAEAHGGSARWEDPGHHGHPSGSRFVVDVPAVRVTTDRGADPEEDTWPGS